MTYCSVFTCFILLYMLKLGDALYEDQVGRFDWTQRHVGPIQHVFFDQSGHSSKRVLVATELGVVAGLNVRNGELGWRQLLDNSGKSVIDDVFVLSHSGSLVRSFNPTAGYLNWETALQSSEIHSGKMALSFGATRPDQLYVMSGGQLTALDTESGAEIWRHTLPDSDSDGSYRFVVAYEDHVVAVKLRERNFVQCVRYSYSGVLEDKSVVSATWLDESSRCEMVDRTLVCIDAVTNLLQSYDVTAAKGGAFSATVIGKAGDSSFKAVMTSLSSAAVSNYIALWTAPHRVSIVQAVSGRTHVVQQLEEVAAVELVMREGENPALLSASRSSSETVTLRGVDVVTGQPLSQFSLSIRFAAHHGLPKQLHTFVFKRRDDTAGHRHLLLSEDMSLALVQQSGKLVWCREEALSTIASLEMVDLPVSQSQAKMDTNSHTKSIFELFTSRITSQLNQLWMFGLRAKDMLRVPQHNHRTEDEENEDDLFDDPEYLTRDEFNLHKVIVAITAAGKLYGLDGPSGRLVWRHFLPHFKAFRAGRFPLFVQRSTAHFPHAPRVSVIGRHALSGTAILYSFNPITGQPVSGIPRTGLDLGYKVTQVALLAQTDQQFLKPIVLLDDVMTYHIYPESARKTVLNQQPSFFTFVADLERQQLTGYSMTSQMKAETRWKVDLSADEQEIGHVVMKRPQEHVHSHGVVLGDRSVLYKYLNPNLALVTTEGMDNQQKGVISIYLLDAVTGNIVFSCVHKKAKGPVNVVHSENWVVYSYWSLRSRRMEMAVLELFEGTQQSNATTFSSFNPPPPPIVSRTAFIFPGHISAMATTISEKGITNKNVLIALNNGQVLELPKAFLDPRRPVVPTAMSREEGIIPYIPELPRPYEATINYNQSVHLVRDIHTAPAGLESTCLVLVVGLDLFYTRTQPSKAFDVLKEDFDYFFISSVVIGMVAASVISQKLAARKTLQRAWK